ncbi:unnamed protein product [Chrysodeixis includens]|uniref:Uncharacterized protein n=1 Tax=Chrysodeixis includens TaxID=689277 RepID=A0A9P0BSE2_CHRIL|nr:unnamed protein product [Chrysodeixis includens]
MDDNLIIIVSVFSCAWAFLLLLTLVLWGQVRKLQKKVTEMQSSGRMRIQKLKLSPENQHAFHNPALLPDEELSRRGYSMYMAQDDVESGRHERQTGGQFVEKPAVGQFAEQTTNFSERPQNGHLPERPINSNFSDRSTQNFSDRQNNGNFERPSTGNYGDRPSTGNYGERPQSGHFVDELTRELDNRQQRGNNPPPFLLQSIQESRRKTRSLNSPANNGRQSDTNPNFIY